MKHLFLITAIALSASIASANDHDRLKNYTAKDITVLFEIADKNNDSMLSVEEVNKSAILIVDAADDLEDMYKKDNDDKKDGFWDIF